MYSRVNISEDYFFKYKKAILIGYPAIYKKSKETFY